MGGCHNGTEVAKEAFESQGSYLRVMPVSSEVTLTDLLPMIILSFVDPPLTGIRQGASRAHPVQILPLSWSLVAATVIETFVG